jgi:hypothetical protein
MATPGASMTHPPIALEEHSMTPHPFIDLAAQLARVFVVGMSIAAVVAVPTLLILAVLL